LGRLGAFVTKLTSVFMGEPSTSQKRTWGGPARKKKLL